VRPSRPVALLTALPFMAVFAAQDVHVGTRLEPDGTGIRRVVLVAHPDRRKTVGANIAKMDPKAQWIVRQNRVLAEEYRFEQDARFTRGSAFSDLRVTRQTTTGGPSIVRTKYEYADTITRTAYNDTDKERQAAPETKFEYSVTMPGEIDMASISPRGGKVNGQTVTWVLSADKPTIDVAATSARPEWMFLVLLLYVVLVALASGLRFGLARWRGKPRRI